MSDHVEQGMEREVRACAHQSVKQPTGLEDPLH